MNVYEIVNQKILEQLKAGDIPWADDSRCFVVAAGNAEKAAEYIIAAAAKAEALAT